MKKFKNLLIFVTVLVLFSSLTACISFAAGLESPILKAENKSNCIAITWNKVPNAKQYEIYKNENSQWVKKSVTEKTSFSDKQVQNGKNSSYKVRAISTFQKSQFSKINLTFLSKPTVKASTKPNGIKLKWSASRFAETYLIYKKSASADYSLIAAVSGKTSSYLDTKITSGTSYGYKVAVKKGSSTSALSSPAKKVFLSRVQSLSVKNSPNGVTLHWNKVNGAVGYSVFRKTSGQKAWVKVGDTKNLTSFIDKSTAYGKKNYYKVRAFYNADSYGACAPFVSLYSVNPNKKMVALTYDDGPYSSVTNSILDTLSSYGARATFFVVGSRLSAYKDCLVRENKLGCQIGCHTYNHTILTSASPTKIKDEISQTNNLIKQYTGQTVKLVRAPGGSVNQTVKSNVGYPLINWSVDTQDWKNRNATTTFNNFKSTVRDGSIVLMHDLYPSTATATKSIVPYLINNGYQIVTVSEMMDAKGITMQKGGLYSKAY